MAVTQHFINDGYGWMCRRCRAADDSHAHGGRAGAESLARFFREGEAEEREPRLSMRSLARWKDTPGGTLTCPLCGVEEHVGASRLGSL